MEKKSYISSWKNKEESRNYTRKSFCFCHTPFPKYLQKIQKTKRNFKKYVFGGAFHPFTCLFYNFDYFYLLNIFLQKKKSMGETQQGKKKTKINFNYKLKERKTLGSLEGCPKTISYWISSMLGRDQAF